MDTDVGFNCIASYPSSILFGFVFYFLKDYTAVKEKKKENNKEQCI